MKVAAWQEVGGMMMALGVAWLPLASAAAQSEPAQEARAESATKFATIDEAIARGDVADVRLHLRLDPARVRARAGSSLSPLQQAALRNRTEIAIALLEAGADVNEVDRSRRTALHLATDRGNAALVTALLARHADPNARDQAGWTPLHHAAAKDRVAIARALLKAGADVTLRSELGGTALHEAGASGSADMVQLLLDHDVDPRVVSKTGVTALDVARQLKNEPAEKVLSALAGADEKR